MGNSGAVVVRYGRRRVLVALPGVVVLVGVGVLGVWAVFARQWHAGSVGAWVATGVLVLLGGVGVLVFWLTWRERGFHAVVDGTGITWRNGALAAVTSWDSLAGAGIHWARRDFTNAVSKKYTLELCPAGDIDRDDALLWQFVRDEEPLRPGLPRLRYRVPLLGGPRGGLATAVQRFAPHLWFGQVEREWGYGGVPDAKGHRERAREA
ncbi:hypothetical protein AB0M28_09125 [Streptomyces sp. NPDC051940]|uniref:hypothetical protein n=1 Tax=Streptomyces sp. NPDC051940 TaxID=3155675 RepID=UPI00341EFA1D